MISKFSNSRGFAILYAVLMVSIILTISLTLLDITFKQLVLSSINRESKTAYYAAVNALDCATYWDSIAADSATGYDPYYAFGHFTQPGSIFNFANKQIKCAGAAAFIPSYDSGTQTFTFTLSFPQVNSDPSQAVVTVIKGNGVGNNGVAVGGTLIRVDGYNTSNSNNPRRVQRSLDSS